MCKYVAGVADCVGLDSSTMGEGSGNAGDLCQFFDAIIDGMLVSIAPLIDAITIVVDADVDLVADLVADIPNIVADLGLFVENPLEMITVAGVDIPWPIVQAPIPEVDIAIAIPTVSLELALGLLMIPLDFVIGAIEGLPELPVVPTLEAVIELITPLFPGLPAEKIACMAEIPMVPFNAIADALPA